MPSSAELSQQQQKSFSQKVVSWYHQHGRKNLPWQQEKGSNRAYHVWLSEIMLQQTQVVKVVEYFNRFIAALPTLRDLAEADEDQVLALWSGLGYYNRARNLHKTAQLCLQNHHATLPNNMEQLIDLPGIGRSTAAAIMSLAYNFAEPIMDGNVKRVFARHFLVAGEPNKSSTLKQFWSLAETHREQQEPAAYTQGLMDLGATVCSKHQPKCHACPIEASCQAKANNVIELFPEKKQKVQQKEVHLFALLSIQGNQVALKQRSEQGIWPSLWFVPLFESQKALQVTYPEVTKQFSITHKLTHRILQIHVFLSNQPIKPDSVSWITIEELRKYPHPKALIHILEQHENH